MTVGSLFAGIGGFDLGLERAGFHIAWQVEIDAFCGRVLAKHWPYTPRWADVREWTGDGYEPVDLLCGGFPCTDLSVAGKRAGLSGKQSGLFWEIVRIAKELRPPFLLLENVPGLLSSNNGEDIMIILDALYELGYIVEVDECDSRYFGVAQRRRRLFFIGINASVGLLGRTLFSSRTRCAFLAQSLLDALESLSRPWPTDASGSDSSAGIAERGLLRKMRCCEASLGKSAWLNWLSVCTDQLQPSVTAPSASDSPHGESGLPDELDTDALVAEASFAGNIWRLWRELWGDLSESPKASTISTWSKQTTDLKICICAEISLLTYWHTVASKPSSPHCWNAVSSTLTAVLASIESAERIANDLFATPTWRDRARLFLEQADHIISHATRHFAAAGVEAVLFESEGGGGDSQAGGEAGAELTVDVAACLRGVGGTPRGFCNDGEQGLVCVPLIGKPYGDQLGDESKLVMAFQPKASSTQSMNLSAQSPTIGTGKVVGIVSALTNLGGGGPDDNEAQAGHLVPIAEIGAKTQMGAGRNGCGIGNDGDPMFALQTGKQHGVGVRRLTPTETERLQGFPDGWSCLCQPLAAYDPHACICPDSPRYRAMGNAVTVPVITWLGQRLREAMGR